MTGITNVIASALLKIKSHLFMMLIPFCYFLWCHRLRASVSLLIPNRSPPASAGGTDCRTLETNLGSPPKVDLGILTSDGGWQHLNIRRHSQPWSDCEVIKG